MWACTYEYSVQYPVYIGHSTNSHYFLNVYYVIVTITMIALAFHLAIVTPTARDGTSLFTGSNNDALRSVKLTESTHLYINCIHILRIYIYICVCVCVCVCECVSVYMCVCVCFFVYTYECYSI